MALRSFIVEQFRKPSGLLGALAGWIMARRGSNVERNRWTVSLLDIRQGDRVLELGFGPGLGVALAAEMVGPTGRVVGIDHSPVMLAQAERRNRALIEEGRVALRLCSLDQIGQLPGPFDKVFSSNVLQFETDKAAVVRSILQMMRPGSKMATTFQPRMRNATAADARKFASNLVGLLKDAGFVGIQTHTLPLPSVPAVCVIAHAPDDHANDHALSV